MVRGRVSVAWSLAALRDLDRFAVLLREVNPKLAAAIARSILDKVKVLADHPLSGRPVGGARFRQIVLRVEHAAYVIQCRFEGRRVTIVRVHHGREDRTIF